MDKAERTRLREHLAEECACDYADDGTWKRLLDENERMRAALEKMYGHCPLGIPIQADADWFRWIIDEALGKR